MGIIALFPSFLWISVSLRRTLVCRSLICRRAMIFRLLTLRRALSSRRLTLLRALTCRWLIHFRLLTSWLLTRRRALISRRLTLLRNVVDWPFRSCRRLSWRWLTSQRTLTCLLTWTGNTLKKSFIMQRLPFNDSKQKKYINW